MDLEIRITAPWGHGERAFRFVLDSPSGAVELYQKPISGPPIYEPETFRRELLKQVASLGRGQDADGKRLPAADRLAEMVAIGQDLYRKLFPRELRAIFADVSDRVSTLLITSDEPWIPWEVLHPFDDGDDDFLCMRFQMSRWLTGDAPLLPRKHVGNVLALQAGSKAKLASAAHEVELLESLCQTAGARGEFLPSVKLLELSHQLEEQGFDLIHFAGHGRGQTSACFGSARIDLGDRSLRPRNFTPTAEQQLRASRPMVFLNSCQVGQLGQDLTELGGWAPHWVGRCRSSAFLGPGWAVDDTRALHFAQTFYGELFAGKTLGEAVRISRMVLRDAVPGELTWLAYCLYGHPGAPITLGPPRSKQAGASSGRAVPASTAGRKVTRATTSRPATLAPRALGGAGLGVRGRRYRRRALVLGAVLLILAVVLLAVFWLTGSNTGKGPGDTPVVSHKDPPVPRVAPVPLLPVAAGEVVIVAIDTATGRPAQDIARVVRSILAQGATSIRPSVTQEPSEVLRVVEGRDASVLPQDGRAPWGAERLLVVRVSERNLPQSAPNLVAVSLTVESEILATETGDVRLAGPETNTGIGVSRSQALEQALERSLRKTLGILEKGV